MDLELAGKRAVVASASRGIGKAVALALAYEGCTVTITSSNKGHLVKTAGEVAAATGVGVDCEVLDARDPESVEQACARILDRHAGIDILVTNGPGPAPMPALGIARDALTQALQTNLVSTVQMCGAFLPGMMDRRFGRIINLVSSTAKEPDPGLVLSNVARAGVLAYAKTLSREVAAHGVTVNSILTGGVMTDRTVDLIRRDAQAQGRKYDDVLREAAAAIPIGRIATPEEFAHAIVFLASARAGYVTGVGLPIDGGFMRGL